MCTCRHLIKMAEYWLISVPGEKTLQQSWETLNNATMRNQVLSTNYKFAIPDLKVPWHQLVKRELVIYSIISL